MTHPSQFPAEIEYVSKILKALKGRVVWDERLLGKFYVFKDRLHAGEALARLLQRSGEGSEGLVLAIPNGGIPVGVVLAEKLRLGFDLAICRKLQIPWNKEAGFGALAPDGSLALNKRLMESLNLNSKALEAQKEKALEELKAKERRFRGDRPPPNLKGKNVILVDDGLASGYTVLAAVRYAWRSGASKVVVAVPTGSIGALRLVAGEASKVYCANVRGDLLGFAVADAYQQWYDVGDEEAVHWLRKASGWEN
jgi:predicted phosphoribosyltransferase